MAMRSGGIDYTRTDVLVTEPDGVRDDRERSDVRGAVADIRLRLTVMDAI